ncbi:hypothetical protein N8Y61_02280 [Akkermansiaceae bacterium]|nr:hypothetical protein [Akkermansiaceae bacterium]
MRWALFNSFLLWAGVAQGLTIQVDYRYDSGGLFSASGNPDGAAGAVQARAAIEVVAECSTRLCCR